MLVGYTMAPVTMRHRRDGKLGAVFASCASPPQLPKPMYRSMQLESRDGTEPMVKL